MFAHRYADQVETGDEFLVEESNDLVAVAVLSTSAFQMQGNFKKCCI